MELKDNNGEGNMREFDINHFKKQHECLICIDSDGTAIDAMNAKHNLCHGPAFIKEWHFESIKEKIQSLWNNINLYQESRGVNRFIALVEILQILQKDKLYTENILGLSRWVETTDDLSNKGLESEIVNNRDPLLKKALMWSYDINRRIAMLSHLDKPPFQGVRECLEYCHGKVDIAIISSSNMSALLEEWGNHDLLRYVDVITSQEVGTKGECIAKMLEKGYHQENVLMIGDAYPDLEAANSNHVYFYPILINYEKHSWQQLQNRYLNLFISNQFEDQSKILLQKFKDNFSTGGA